MSLLTSAVYPALGDFPGPDDDAARDVAARPRRRVTDGDQDPPPASGERTGRRGPAVGRPRGERPPDPSRP